MAGYLGASPVPQTIQKKQSFTATASQTTFTTTGYTDGAFINVYLNGVRLINGTDYTATNGSDIVLTSAASASDVLDFETFNEFTLVDQTLETPTFRTSATLKNDTEEDTDGGRESTLIFKGEQSGGEISTLAEIEASHDGTADDEKGDLIFRTNDGSDGASPTEAARIDSAQNLLVGKTSSNATDVGIVANANGRLYATASGSSSIFNRTTSDGDIIDIRKDGSTVGAIGTDTGDLHIHSSASGHAGLRFGNGRLQPTDNAGATSDNTIDLGVSSSRFKDLYLSGGAYIGGTVAANYLEDYETGTWTPTVTHASMSGSVSYSSQLGYYVKVGSLVNAVFFIEFQHNSATGGNVQVHGLPFTSENLTGHFPQAAVMLDNLNVALDNPLLQVANNATRADMIANNGSTATHSGLNFNTYISGVVGTINFRASLVYRTSA